MASDVILDTREFDKAMVQYAAASKKDFKDIANKRVYDVSLRSMRHMKKADRQAIRTLLGEKDLLWWFAWKIYMPRGMTRKQAFKKAQGLIRRRGKASGFLKGFFRKMSLLISPFVENARAPSKTGKGSFAGFTPIVKPATKQRPTAEVGVRYNYKSRTQTTASATERLLLNALRGGIRDTTADMMKYVDRKMGKTAKRYSARRAA